MPDRNPVETGPYHLQQRFRAHPGMGVLAIWSFLAGVAMLIDSRLPGPTVSVTLSAMPDGFRLWVSTTMVLGSIAATAGLLGNWNRLDRSWRIERAGWWLVLGAWGTMGAVAVFYTPLGIVAWGDFFAFSIMAYLRQRAVAFIDRQTRQQLEDMA